MRISSLIFVCGALAAAGAGAMWYSIRSDSAMQLQSRIQRIEALEARVGTVETRVDTIERLIQPEEKAESIHAE